MPVRVAGMPARSPQTDSDRQAPAQERPPAPEIPLAPPTKGGAAAHPGFDEAADERYPYMYHCHMTNHEDEGLMGQFVVR